MNRLKEGYVLTKNPMNPTQISRIELSPETIDCIVFWTKDPANMMDKLSFLDSMGYSYYFQFTLTPYGKGLERNLRDKKDICRTFGQLSSRLGKDRVLWRYDPIILNDVYTMDFHTKAFTELCRELQGFTEICTISFVDMYQKLHQSVKNNVIRTISESQMHQLAAELSSIGDRYGLELRACCENIDLTSDGIKPASCVDKNIIERICGHSINVKKDKNQRIGCGCLQSIDIGIYNTCRHGCVYCYANHSSASIEKNCNLHDPTSHIMVGEVSTDAKIINRMQK